MEEKELVRLIETWKNGDENAYDTIYNEYYDAMLRIALTHTMVNGKVNRADAEDILQDAMLKAYLNIQSLDKPENFPQWLTKIVKNRASDYMTSAMKKHNVLFTDATNDDGKGKTLEFDKEDERISARPDIQLDNQVKEDILSEIMDHLSEDQRVVTLMYFYDEMTMKEIAEKLDIEQSTVIGRLQTAKKNIKNEVTAIQKRDDIKLYNISAIPAVSFFMWLLGKADEESANILSLPVIGEVKVAGTNELTSKVTDKAAKVASSASKRVVTKTMITKVVTGVAVTACVASSGFALYKNNIDTNPKEAVTEKEKKETENTEKVSNNEKEDETQTVDLHGLSFSVSQKWNADYYYLDTKIIEVGDPTKVVLTEKGKEDSESLITVTDSDPYYSTVFEQNKLDIFADSKEDKTIREEIATYRKKSYGNNTFLIFSNDNEKKVTAYYYTKDSSDENSISVSYSYDDDDEKYVMESVEEIMTTMDVSRWEKEDFDQNIGAEVTEETDTQADNTEQVEDQSSQQSYQQDTPAVYSPSKEAALAFFLSTDYMPGGLGEEYENAPKFIITADDPNFENAETQCAQENPDKSCVFMPMILYNENNNQYMNVDKWWDGASGAPGINIDDVDSYKDYAWIFPIVDKTN